MITSGPENADLAFEKLIAFKIPIVECFDQKDVFELCKKLIESLKSAPEKSFGMSVIFREFLYPISLSDTVEIKNKARNFHEIFNCVVVELIKDSKQKEDTINRLVLPFVNDFFSFGLSEGPIRGLIHKLEELDSQLTKTYYDLGTKYQIYPFQDMEDTTTIKLRTHYSFFEIKVIINEVFNDIVKVVSAERLTLFYQALQIPEIAESGNEHLKYRIRLEKLSNPAKTNLTFLDRLDLSTLQQSFERISRVLESYDSVKIKLRKKRIQDEKGVLILEIDSASLIDYLYQEHIQDDPVEELDQ